MNAKSIGDTRDEAHALVDTLADTLAEVKVVTLAEKRGDTHALVDTLAATVAEV